MPTFAGASPLVLRTQAEIEGALGRALAALPASIVEDYRESAEEARSSVTRFRSFSRWILVNLFLSAGALQASIRWNGAQVFAFGVEILPWESSEWSLFGTPFQENLSLVQASGESHGRVLNVWAVVPRETLVSSRAVLENDLLRYARNTYFHVPAMQERRLIDLTEPLLADLSAAIQGGLAGGKTVTVTHFRFQDMTHYFEMSGEHVAREILHSIQETIRQNLKKSDLLFALTPESYLVISPGAQSDVLHERFRTIYFQTHGLVLDYTIRVVSVDRQPVRLNKIWKELGL